MQGSVVNHRNLNLARELSLDYQLSCQHASQVPANTSRRNLTRVWV